MEKSEILKKGVVSKLASKKCPYCDKWIEGYSKNIDYLLKQHILAKHKEKIKIEDFKNDKKDLHTM